MLPRILESRGFAALLFFTTMVAGSPRSVAADAPVPAAAPLPPTPATYRHLADEVDGVLAKEILDKWFPAAVDNKGGGFIENFGVNWTPAANNPNRSIVYQARLTWLAANAAEHFPAKVAEYKELSRHGLTFLAEKQWDPQQGGFYWSVTTAGAPSNDRPNEKHVYGNAFGIYAAAAEYKLTHDPAALELAKKGFAWLEAHAHDAKNGGYIEALNVAGQPLTPTAPRGGRGGGAGSDAIGTPIGQKSMNTHIHLLEALTELYQVWPDPLVRARAQEIYDLALKEIYTDPGYLTMFFTPEWQKVPSRNGRGDSFGHNIEAAYLFTDAAAVLGRPNDEVAWKEARKLVDHALQYGYDKEHGGFFNEGTTTGGNLDTAKIWWVEAEGLYALLLMHERFGHETSVYWDTFLQQWKFISEHQLDHVNGGWYPSVVADGSAPAGDGLRLKSNQWTEGYHEGRALINVANKLRELADAGKLGAVPVTHGTR